MITLTRSMWDWQWRYDSTDRGDSNTIKYDVCLVHQLRSKQIELIVCILRSMYRVHQRLNMTNRHFKHNAICGARMVLRDIEGGRWSWLAGWRLWDQLVMLARIESWPRRDVMCAWQLPTGQHRRQVDGGSYPGTVGVGTGSWHVCGVSKEDADHP